MDKWGDGSRDVFVEEDIMLASLPEANCLVLTNIELDMPYVMPAHQGRNLARILFEMCLQCVLAGTDDVVRLYSKAELGFRTVGKEV